MSRAEVARVVADGRNACVGRTPVHRGKLLPRVRIRGNKAQRRPGRDHLSRRCHGNRSQVRRRQRDRLVQLRTGGGEESVGTGSRSDRTDDASDNQDSPFVEQCRCLSITASVECSDIAAHIGGGAEESGRGIVQLSLRRGSTITVHLTSRDEDHPIVQERRRVGVTVLVEGSDIAAGIGGERKESARRIVQLSAVRRDRSSTCLLRACREEHSPIIEQCRCVQEPGAVQVVMIGLQGGLGQMRK